MRLFLALAGILAWLFGCMLLFIPGEFYAPIGIAMTPMIATLAQAHGATLVGLGTINFLGRKAEGDGLTAILGGNLAAQLLSLVVVILTMRMGPGMKLAPGVIIHVALSALFAWFLVRHLRQAK